MGALFVPLRGAWMLGHPAGAKASLYLMGESHMSHGIRGALVSLQGLQGAGSIARRSRVGIGPRSSKKVKVQI